MSDISDASDLLATARESVLRELLPALPAEQRYAARMIANAISIASREHAAGGHALAREAGRLRELLRVQRQAAPVEGAAQQDEQTRALRQALAAAIRRGAFDETGRSRALQEHLLRTAEDQVAISNPRALASPAG
jgi:hypothetical protein